MAQLDVAAKRGITHAAVFTSDLLPAFELAQQEGIVVWLVHGPPGTYAEELWELADDRFSVDDGDFMRRIERVKRA